MCVKALLLHGSCNMYADEVPLVVLDAGEGGVIRDEERHIFLFHLWRLRSLSDVEALTETVSSKSWPECV